MSWYQNKLQDPRWQKRRLEKLQSSGFGCQICGDKQEQLHVHHCSYQSGRNPWEYGDWELMTLCQTCHSLTHFKQEKVKAYCGSKKWTHKYIKFTDFFFCSISALLSNQRLSREARIQMLIVKAEASKEFRRFQKSVRDRIGAILDNEVNRSGPTA